jgi:hypothetical protein
MLIINLSPKSITLSSAVLDVILTCPQISLIGVVYSPKSLEYFIGMLNVCEIVLFEFPRSFPNSSTIFISKSKR